MIKIAHLKMHPKFPLWISAMALLLSMGSNTTALRETQMNAESQSSSGIMDPGNDQHPEYVTLKFEDLNPGNTLPLYQLSMDPSTSPRFLPKKLADLIPFSLSKLPFILDLFGLPRDSPEAGVIKDTLTMCEAPPMKGETRACVTSFESMLSLVHKTFGALKFKPLTTQQIDRTGHFLQNYTIMGEPRRVAAQKMLACHTSGYPYMVYLCHYFVGDNQVFKVNLKSEETGIEYEVVVVCHMDTSEWSPEQPFLKVNGIKPGSIPVCHFVPTDTIVWVPRHHGSPQI